MSDSDILQSDVEEAAAALISVIWEKPKFRYDFLSIFISDIQTYE